MIAADGVLGLAVLVLFVFCVIDVITTPDADVRNLPKLLWLLIVIVLPLVGSVAWLVAGRRQGPSSSRTHRSETAARAYPEYDHPGRAVPANADDDEAFLAQVRARAEAQRRDYDLRRRAEQAEEENRQRGLRDDRD